MVNKRELEIPGYVGRGPGPHELGAGFPACVAPPRIVFEKKRTRQQLDFYALDRIWVISDRLKAILENFDREGFEFVRAKTLYNGGTREGPSYWFCDVIRVLDCVDEAASTLNYYPTPNSRVSMLEQHSMTDRQHSSPKHYRRSSIFAGLPMIYPQVLPALVFA